MHKISPSSAFVGQNQIFIEAVSSTNEVAKDILRNQAPQSGFLIWSNFQHGGKGQKSNSWFGDAGKNVYASFILTPLNLNAENVAMLNFACTLAVCDCLSHFVPHDEIAVKWPNDIMISKRKVAGILIENQVSGQSINRSVFGVGINVNQERFPNGLSHAASLLQLLGGPVRIGDVLEKLCECLETRTNQLQNMQYSLIHGQINELLYAKGELISYRENSVLRNGILVGVNERGEIELESDGEISRFSQGEVSLDLYGTSH